MTDVARTLVQRSQRKLIGIAVLRAALWAMATAVFVRVFLQWSLSVTLPLVWQWALLVIFAVGAIGLSLWRDRPVFSNYRVAVWLEERLPQLRYALLTLLEARRAGRLGQSGKTLSPEHQAGLLQAIAAANQAGLDKQWRSHCQQALKWPAVALMVALLAMTVVLWWPAGLSWSSQRLADSEDAQTRALTDITAVISPPRYTARPPVTEVVGSSIRALEGSSIALNVLLAGASSELVTAQLGDKWLPVVTGGADVASSHWQLQLEMPREAVTLSLQTGAERRVLVLEPEQDAVPQLRLLQPAEDTTMAQAEGVLTLRASIEDDIGLAKGWFEIIVSSGQSEGDYTSRTLEVAVQEWDGSQRSAHLEFVLPLSELDLQAGGQLSIRAIALDGNTLTGPGVGYSETRTIRVARLEEAASIDITPAPPALDESLMSLRMLIRSTERLQARREQMARETFIEEVLPLAGHTDDIRKKVQSLVDETSQGGSFPVPELLQEALDAMWEASRSMAVAETAEALPPLHKAHEALKALSNASKYFVRGAALPAHVNVDEVRMTGEEEVHASARSSREVQASTRERLAQQLREVTQTLQRDKVQGVQALALLRVQALREMPTPPEFAQALDAALLALQGGEAQEVQAALQQARQSLAGVPHIHEGLPAWSAAMDGGGH